MSNTDNSGPGMPKSPGASAYVAAVNSQLEEAWQEALKEGNKLASKISVVGGGKGAKLMPSQVADFLKLVNALRIPPSFNGMDLIIGVMAGGQIKPYVTLSGEWALTARDPRGLQSVESWTNSTPAGNAGVFVTVTSRVRFENGDYADGTDVVFVPAYGTFLRRLEEYAWKIAEIDLRGGDEPSDLKGAIELLGEAQRRLNRFRAFSLRFAEGAARRRAMKAARKELPIVPMADEEMLGQVTVEGRQQLVLLFSAQAVDPETLCKFASEILGEPVVSITQIPDDEETCTTLWRTWNSRDENVWPKRLLSSRSG